MAGLHEIKTRIESVKSTQQITRAMYLISASKSKKAKITLENSKPYFKQIAVTLAEILKATQVFDTPYLGKYKKGTSDKVLYIVLSGDKGMAGGYNHNILRLLNSSVDKENSVLWIAGFMGRNLISRYKFDVDKGFHFPVMNPNVYRARDITELLVEKFLAGDFKEVHLVYTAMLTPIKQEPLIVQLLPLKPEKFLMPDSVLGHINVVKYEPSREDVFNHLVPHYIKGILYGALVEAFTSEQHARMYAMDNASKSADDMISNLSIRYNRARQAQITQEINEIVGGIPSE